MNKIVLFNFIGFFFFQQLYKPTTASCYFPLEFQGEYKMQSSNSGDGVQYSVLNITTNSIPIWGNCHRRIGNNFILMINYGSNSCIRCLHLKLRSRNILQVHAAGDEPISKKCYTNEESAVANCPVESSLHKRFATEIILFKTKDSEGNNIQKEYCPIYGKYNLRYFTTDKYYRRECTGYESDLDSCPSGATLNIHFKQCIFASYDLKFDCLGNWEAPNGQMYLALIDHRHLKNRLPQYRCAMYKRNESTGNIYLALGKDSTCNTDLYNASYGHEVFELVPIDENNWPQEVNLEQCRFPDWLSGDWEHVTANINTFTYRNQSSFETYSMKCLRKESDDKYLVFTRTQCNKEQYNCLRVKKRSTNIMEFQLGINFSNNKNDVDLCSDASFVENSWITQGRLVRKLEASCPISGEYTGVIPDITDITELCAKLWSDCRAPELMYYQVSDCATNEIYEEREYRCLGHWTESGVLYTYTQRKDVASEAFECFVGSIISDKKDIFIKEAGDHCERQIDPLQNGMKLIKQGLYACIGQISTQDEFTTKKLPTMSPTRVPTKSWNIGAQDHGITEGDNTINYSATPFSFKSLIVLGISIIVIVNV